MSKKNKIKLPEDQKKKCSVIIHSASVAAGGVGTGLAQVPLSDNALITPIQIGMIIALGKVFDQDITKSAASAILGGAAASFAGRGLSQLLVGWIPVVGNAINTATAAGITVAIGWMAVDNFSKGKYASIIKEHANDDDEPTKKSENKTDTSYEDDQMSILYKRVEEFIFGEKNKKDNKDEFQKLLNDVEKVLLHVPEGDPLYDLYDKLMDM